MLLQCTFESWSLGRSVSVNVILPTDIGTFRTKSHKKDGKFPVLYLLHGGGADHTQWLRYTSVERYANEHKIAVVMPHCPDMCYRKAAITFPGMAWEGGKLFDFETFFAKELPDWAAANFPISTEPEHSYIAGYSLGGYGAAFTAFTNPENYCAVGLFSAYIFSGALFDPNLRHSLTDEEKREYLIPDLVAPVIENSKLGKKFPKVYLIHGTKEVTDVDPVYAQFLREKGIETEEDYGDYPYGHEWATWEIGVKHFIEWIPRKDDFSK